MTVIKSSNNITIKHGKIIDYVEICTNQCSFISACEYDIEGLDCIATDYTVILQLNIDIFLSIKFFIFTANFNTLL